MSDPSKPSDAAMEAARAYYAHWKVDMRGMDQNVAVMAENFDAFAARARREALQEAAKIATPERFSMHPAANFVASKIQLAITALIDAKGDE